jgi:thiosulfate/3-mercaptopyruvate sulfurtransferase
MRPPSIATLLIAIAASAAAVSCGQGRSASGPTGNPWRPDQLLKPAKLAADLASHAEPRPVVLFVGFPLPWTGGHIPGAIYVGPASKPDGLAKLDKVVSRLAHDEFIVLYCGCCPLRVCPNVRPAFRDLQELGFTEVHVLDLPRDFPKDWTAKGFPTEKGPPPSEG